MLLLNGANYNPKTPLNFLPADSTKTRHLYRCFSNIWRSSSSVKTPEQFGMDDPRYIAISLVFGPLVDL